MIDAVERLVNLALYLADARAPVTREQIRKEVAGYAPDQDEEAFLRMFERDKETLKSSGLVLLSDDTGRYHLDPRATYAAQFRLDPREAATLRAAGAALVDDPSFPFGDDLRLALAKITSGPDPGDVCAHATLADEDPARQGALIATLTEAAASRKLVRFGYTNSVGASAPHEVEPFGVFLHNGRWYLVGRDTDKDEVRTYAVSRMEHVDVNARSPKSPDFERTAGFDIASYIRLPFQYGPVEAEFEAELHFSPDAAWRVPILTAGRGRVTEALDGARWHVNSRSSERLAQFVIENGPALSLHGPRDVLDVARSGLAKVVADHG